MLIAFSAFVRRQTPESEFSHFTISDEEVLKRVFDNWHKRKPGYRDGVILIPIEPDGFFSSVIQLKEGDNLVGQFKARREGEKPRKSTFYAGSASKMPAKSVDIVLYRADVLAEDKDNGRSADSDWEIVSINASPTEEEMPIPTGALIANHLHLSGGTKTNLSDTEFVNLLRKSVEFWSDKALVAPDEFSFLSCLLSDPAEGLDTEDDPNAKPIEEFMPEDERVGWEQYVKEIEKQHE